MSSEDLWTEFRKFREETAVLREEAASARRLAEKADRRAEEAIRETQKLVQMVSFLSPVVDTVLRYDGGGSSTTARSESFKRRLIEEYSESSEQDGLKLIKCSMTNCFLPKTCVIGSHIIKRCWETFRVHDLMLGFREIDDPRNGLLLFNLSSMLLTGHSCASRTTPTPKRS